MNNPALLTLAEIQQLVSEHPVGKRFQAWSSPGASSAFLKDPLRVAAAIHHAGLHERPSLKIMILATNDVVVTDDWRLLGFTRTLLQSAASIQFSVLALAARSPMNQYHTDAQGIALSMPEVKSRAITSVEDATRHLERFQPDLLLVGAELFKGNRLDGIGIGDLFANVDTPCPVYVFSARAVNPLCLEVIARSHGLSVHHVHLRSVQELELKIGGRSSCIQLARLEPPATGWKQTVDADLAASLQYLLYPFHGPSLVGYRDQVRLPMIDEQRSVIRIDGTHLVDTATGHIYALQRESPDVETTHYLATEQWLDAVAHVEVDPYADRDRLTPHVLAMLLALRQSIDRFEAGARSSMQQLGDKLRELGIDAPPCRPLISSDDQRAHRYAAANSPLLLDRLHGSGFSCSRPRPSDGVTPLMMAAACNAVLAIDCLLDLGGNTKARDHHGWTALHYAACNGQTEAYDALIDSGFEAIASEKLAPSDLTVEELLDLANEGLDTIESDFIEDGIVGVMSALDYETFAAFGPLEEVFDDDEEDEDLLDDELGAEIVAEPTFAGDEATTDRLMDILNRTAKPTVELAEDANDAIEPEAPERVVITTRPILACQGALGKPGASLPPIDLVTLARSAIADWLRSMRAPIVVDPMSLEWNARSALGLVTASGSPDLWAMRFDNDSDASGIWRTEIVLAFVGNTAACAVRLIRIGPDDGRVNVSIPRVVRSIVERCGWTQDGIDSRQSHDTVSAPAGLDILLTLIRHADRVQPIVVIAQSADGTMSVDVAEVFKRLSGVAHVVVTSSAMTRLLSRELGSERGLHPGQVRVYRPGFTEHDEASANPLMRTRTTDRGSAFVDRIVREAAHATRYGAGDDSIPTFSNVLVLHAERTHRSTSEPAVTAPAEGVALPSKPPIEATTSPAILVVDAPTTAQIVEEHVAPLQARIDALEAALKDQLRAASVEREGFELRLKLLQEARQDDESRIKDEREKHFHLIDSLREESDRLRRINRDLRVALDDMRAVRQTAGATEEPVPIPDNLAELESWANQHLGTDIVFTSRAIRAARDSDLEDPRPVYESLLMLRDHYLPLLYERTPDRVRAYNQRCAELQVEVSKTGEAVNSSRYGDSYRAHYNGERLPLDMHVSGNSSRNTRRGWRIYFHLKSDQGQIVIGHLPEHIRNHLSSS